MHLPWRRSLIQHLYWLVIHTIHKQQKKNTFSFYLKEQISSFFNTRGHDGTTPRANLSLSSVITFYILRYRLSSAGPDRSVTRRRLNKEANRFFKKMVTLPFSFPRFVGPPKVRFPQRSNVVIYAADNTPGFISWMFPWGCGVPQSSTDAQTCKALLLTCKYAFNKHSSL